MIGGDRQTVFEFGGNWHYKTYFWGLAPQYFWMIVLKWVVMDRLLIEIGGNWHYKIFGRIVLRKNSYMILGLFLGGLFGDGFEKGGDGQTVD